MKKLLSLVLALAMVLTCVSAFAEGTDSPTKPGPVAKFTKLEYEDSFNIGYGNGKNNSITQVTKTIDGSFNKTNQTITQSTKTINGSFNSITQSTKTISGSFNDQSVDVTLTLDVSDIGNNKSMNRTTTLSDVGNNKSENSTVTISGSGNYTDSSNNSVNTFYFGSYNDNSTANKNSGNSSSSSSSSAAGGTAGKSGSGSSSSSGSSSGSGKSGGSSSGSSKGASSSASSKAVVISSGNGGGSGSGSGSGSTTVAPSLELVVVADTAETTALKNAFAEAIKAGDPKTALPENIASKLSADLKTINEFVTAKLVGNISGLASATLNVAFPTKYAAGDKVVILFGIPNGASTQWINVNGIIESDGSISMILTSTVLEALYGKTFALAVLSK